MLRGLLVWLLIMLVETIHGVLRGVLIVPHVGEANAGRIGWPVGMILVLAITFLTIRWTRIRGKSHLVALGAVWAVLTFAFEVMIGILRGLDAQGIMDEINPFSGGLILYSLAVMLFAPLFAARLRKIR